MLIQQNIRQVDDIASGKINELRLLNLAQKGITKLPQLIGNLTGLTELNLYGNQLNSLPDEIGNLTELTHLNLMYNQRTELPDSFDSLIQLENIDLRFNDFMEQPVILESLPKLFNIKFDPQKPKEKVLFPNLRKFRRLKIFRICPSCQKKGALQKRQVGQHSKNDMLLDTQMNQGDYFCSYCNEDFSY